MNFGFSEDQASLRSLAAQVLDDHSAPARLAEVERGSQPYDTELWTAMAGTGLLAAGLAPPHGSGMGMTGAAIVLEEIGRRAVLLPFWASAAVGALVVERSAPPGEAAALLPALADGTSVAVPAFEEPLNLDPRRPRTTARPDREGWVLDGEKVAVPFGPAADLFLVSATGPDGVVLGIVEAGAPGLEVQPARGTAGEPQARLLLDGVAVRAERILPGAADTAYRLALAGLCATAAGLLDGGLRITASYIAGREQFGRPVATFQGPAMRIADAYIDAQAVWTAAWSAIWRLDSGRPADDALAIAKFWVADGGQRAVHAFQHLHGGIGVDVDYPIHRYFAQAKALEVALGGATVQLERLGASIAAAPAGS